MNTPERFDVRFSSRAVKDLRALPAKIATAAFEFIDAVIAANPARVGKPLRKPFEGSHSARPGGYRVMYRIDLEARQIQIERIKHRSDIYKP